MVWISTHASCFTVYACMFLNWPLCWCAHCALLSSFFVSASPQEVLMMLDNYVRDFKALIDWIQLQEKLEKTDAQNRFSFFCLSVSLSVSHCLPCFQTLPEVKLEVSCVLSLASGHKHSGSIALVLIHRDPWVYWLLFNTVTTAIINWLRNEIPSPTSQFVHWKTNC